MSINQTIGAEFMSLIPVSAAAELNEISLESLKRIIYRKTYGNELRFKFVEGVLYVNENYKYPYAQEMEETLQKAIIVSKNENRLCLNISLLSYELSQKEIRDKLQDLSFHKTNPNPLKANDLRLHYEYIKKDTLNKYFYRFTFKRIKRALCVLEYIKLYVKRNSIFDLEDLNYDY